MCLIPGPSKHLRDSSAASRYSCPATSWAYVLGNPSMKSSSHIIHLGCFCLLLAQTHHPLHATMQLSQHMLPETISFSLPLFETTRHMVLYVALGDSSHVLLSETLDLCWTKEIDDHPVADWTNQPSRNTSTGFTARLAAYTASKKKKCESPQPPLGFHHISYCII